VARRRIGTVFQSAGLLERRTAAENVALPLEYLGVTAAEISKRVAELLERVGLSLRAQHYPYQLSGGQRQRVGIARALALRPSVLLSDEATAGLDPVTTTSVVDLLRELRDDLNLSIVFITHEMDTVLKIADSVARLDRGSITGQSCGRTGSTRNPLWDNRYGTCCTTRPRCPGTGSAARPASSACRSPCSAPRCRWSPASASGAPPSASRPS
jgi:ABC-type methionine transport system ATPase subunit